MEIADNRASRHFPHAGWAWPRGELDQLIFAAISPDHTKALATFKKWLKENNIDEKSFREHRLLATISGRFGKELRDQVEYARLVGLQRMLWTKSRMAMAEAIPELRNLTDNQIPVMLIKGAARLALRSGDQKSRMFHDLDILVPRSHFSKTMDTLCDRGWSGSSGESRLCLVARHSNIRGMNFYKGRFGDIDLHQRAYGLARPIERTEAALWDHAVPTTFFDLPVLVPAVEDRIALAIHHSGRDAHNHSDWLVDCAKYQEDVSLDWDRLLTILGDIQTVVPAQIALSYLNEHIGLTMPSQFVTRLMNYPSIRHLERILDTLQAKPRSDWGPLSIIARGIAKQIRMSDQNKINQNLQIISGQSASVSGILAGNAQLIQFLGAANVSSTRFELEIEVELPGVARRLEFELNTEKRHLVRLQVRYFLRRKGIVRLRFSGKLRLKDIDNGIWLEARPGRGLRGGEPQETTDRYCALPFHLTFFKLD